MENLNMYKGSKPGCALAQKEIIKPDRRLIPANSSAVSKKTKLLSLLFLLFFSTITSYGSDQHVIVGWNYGNGKVMYCGMGYMMSHTGGYQGDFLQNQEAKKLFVNMVKQTSYVTNPVVGIFTTLGSAAYSNHVPADTLIAVLARAGITGVKVTSGMIDTEAEINTYNVLILGGSGQFTGEQDAGYVAVQSVVKNFTMNNHGGVIFAGWAVFTSYYIGASDYMDMMPVDASGSYDGQPGYSVLKHLPADPLFNGVGSISSTGYVEFPASGLKSGAIAYGGLAPYVPYVSPTVSTTAVTTFTTTSATMGGNVTNQGTATVDARGVVYSSTDNTPTIGESGVTTDVNGSGTGVFSEPITGLTAGTTYYVRAYATSTAGTSYGGTQNFTTQSLPLSPVITSFSPLTGTIGTTVIITGTGFSSTPASNTVWFGAVKAIVSSSTITSITVTVPAGAGSVVPVTVTVNGLTAYSATCSTPSFNLTNTPNLVPYYAVSSLAMTGNPANNAIGDLNGDGFADIATVNENGNSVGFLLGDGTGNFSAASYITVGSEPYCIAIGDLNGDGKNDMVSANQGSASVSVILGDGAGGFASPVTYSLNNSPSSVNIGDFNGDGIADLVTASYYNSKVSILLGTGGGLFAAATYPVGVTSGSQAIAIGDYNGDGKADLATSNSMGSTISVFLGNGNGTFAAKTDFPSGGSWNRSIGSADFNGDGDADLVVSNQTTSNISILLGNGAGSFSAPSTFAAGGNPYYMNIGDFNGDGNEDIATANYQSANISLLLGDGAGAFAAPATFIVELGPNYLAAGDFNGDGKADIAVSSYANSAVNVLLYTLPCINPSSGGSIAANQIICYGNIPAALSSSVAPSGHNGTLEYKWQSSITSALTGFSDISSSNSAAFSPSALTATTWFKRLARVACTTDWTGAAESNVISVTVNVLPVPVITGPESACVTSTGNVYSTAASMTGYTWTVSAGGTIAAGATTNAITVTWNTAGAQTVSVNYSNANLCPAASATVYNVTVNSLPVPAITGPGSACVTSTGNVYSTAAGMTGYAWTVSAGGTITAGATTNAITVTWNTAGAQSVSVNYTNGNLCTAASATVYNVTVNPLPTVNTIANQGLCNGASSPAVTFSGAVSGTIFNWVNNTPSIGLAASGSGDISSFTATNPGTAAVAATVTVTPVTSSSLVFSGSLTASDPSLNAGRIRRLWATSYCATPTSYPGPWSTGPFYYKTHTLTNTTGQEQCISVTYVVNGTGDVQVTAYSGSFDPNDVGINYLADGGNSSTAGSTQFFSFTLANNATVVLVANDINENEACSSYSITVDGLLQGSGCTGTPTSYTITVNPTPTVNSVGNQVVCKGANTSAISFSGSVTGTDYNWTNDNASIGLAASGSGNISAFTAINTGSIPVTSTITVTPSYTNAGVTCTGTPTAFTITVNPLPVPVITGPASACVTSTGNVYSTAAGMTGYTWTVSAGGTITAGATTNAITVTWNTAGAQSVSVNYTNANLCTAATATVYDVTVNPLPVPVITGPASACVTSTGNVYSTAAGMTGYTWTVSAGGTITAGATTNAITVTWNTAGAQTVSVNYTNGNLCTAATATVYDVTVNPLPVPVITGPASACVTSTGNAYSTAAGMTGYTWTVSAGGTITAGATTNAITVAWNTAGAQTVSVNYTNGNSCTAAAATVYDVTVNSLPVPVITGPVSACATSTGNVYSTAGSMTGYTWTVSAGGTITSGAATNSITVTWNTAGAQSVSVNYTNANLCTAASATVYDVTVNPLPVPVITGPVSACVTSTGNVYSTAASMTGYTWTVSSGGTITAGATTNAITITWNTAGAQTVSVNYTNANSCTAATATVYDVTVNPLPVPVITGPASACVTSTGNSYSTAGSMTGYTWTVSAGGTITAGAATSAITVTWNTAGAQNVSVNYTNGNLCTSVTATVYDVTVNPLPVPTVTGPAVVCSHSTGHTYTSQTGMSGYLWSVSAGGTITAGAGTNAITVTWNTAGAQTVSVNYTNANTCTAAIPTLYSVLVNELPVPTISGPAETCQGITSNVYTTEVGMTGYLWSVSTGGTITSGNGTNAITVTWNTAGLKTVSVNYTNASGCSALTPVVFNVQVNPATAPVIAGENEVCAGTNDVVYTTDAGFSNYAWSISYDGIITTGMNTNQVTVNWATAGSRTISVNYDNSTGCSATASSTYHVAVLSVPVPIISGATSLCQGTSGVTYTTQLNYANYAWTISSGGTIASGTGTNAITVNWTGSGNQVISVEYTNDLGCAPLSPTAFNVFVTPLPATPVVTQHGDTLTSNSASGNQWYLNGVIIAGAIAQQHIAVYTGNYSVVVTNEGCSSVVSNSILVLPVSINDIEVSQEFEVYPNPNQGQFNIKVTSSKPVELNIDIFNNVGVLVWKQEKVTIDGTYITPVDLDNVSNGVYMVCLHNAKTKLFKRIIIQK